MSPQQKTNESEGDWASSIEEAIRAVDPLISNFQITRCHYLLSEALRAAIGGEPGANFHSWAVWGSRKAGVTIRQEDRDQASRDATIVAGIVGGLVGALVGYLMSNWMGLSIAFSMLVWIAIGIVTGGFCGFKLAGYTRTAAARLVLEGNRLVLDDIGRVTARFLQYTNESPDGHDVAAYERFQSDLLQSESTHGDRELLLRAFDQYEASRLASDDAVRHEASYFANCLAILHEHIRLQPYISKSLPFLISKCVTQRLMTFNVGEETLAVHEDVPPLNKALFPPTLEKLANEELIEFLHGPDGWDTKRQSLGNTATNDWTKLPQRMGYIVNLFRSRHLEPGITNCPYSAEQLADIGSGEKPARPW